MESHLKKEKLLGLLITIIFPVFAALYAIFYFKRVNSKLYLIIFSGIFGFFMVFNNQDGRRHGDNFSDHYITLKFSDFIDESYLILTLKPSSKTDEDIYIHFISFAVAQFTSDPRYFFCVIGLIYGFFYINSISLALKKIKIDTFFMLSVFFLFFFWKSFEGINTVRTWTAMWIYVYGLLLFLESKNKFYLLISFLSAFVHIGFVIFLFPIFVYFIVGHRPKLYLLVLLFSFIFSNSQVLIGTFERTIAKSSKVAEDKFRIYAKKDDESVEKYVEKKDEKSAANSILKNTFEFYPRRVVLLVFLSYLLIYGYHKANPKKEVEAIFHIGSISVLIFIICNFLSFIPPVFSRGYYLAGFLSIYFIMSSESQLKVSNSLLITTKNLIRIILYPTTLVVLLYKTSSFSEFLDSRILISPLLVLLFEYQTTIKAIFK